MMTAVQLALVVLCFNAASGQEYSAEECATNRIKIGQGVQDKMRKVFGVKFYPPMVTNECKKQTLNLALDGAVANHLKDSAGLLQRIKQYAVSIIQRTLLSTLTTVSGEQADSSLSRVNDAIRTYNGYVTSGLKEAATSFVSEVFPTLFRTIDAILTYSNSYSASYDQLIEYADMIDTDPQARENLTSQLTSLQNEITSRRNEAIEIGRKLRSYSSLMTIHSSEVNFKYNSVVDAINGDQGYMSHLHNRRTRLQAERDDLEKRFNDTQRRGLWDDFVPFSCFIPWGGRFRSGPRLQIEKDEKEDEIRRHNRQTEEVSRQIVNAERMKSDVIEMTKLIAEATNKTDGITRAWQVVETNYESVIYALRTDGSNRATIVRRLLVVAINDWNKLARNAFAIKRQASQNR